MVFSIYISENANDDSSFIKFGGWDTSFLEEGEELKMISTKGNTQWAVFPLKPRINGEFLNLDSKIKRSIIIDPGYPFIHFLKVDFATLKDQFNTLLSDLNIQKTPTPCQEGKWTGANYCAIDRSCADIKQQLENDGTELRFGVGLANSPDDFFRVTLTTD